MPVLSNKMEDSVQHMFKCKEPKIKACKEELYEYICALLKEQDTQQTLIEMITTILFNQPIIIT